MSSNAAGGDTISSNNVAGSRWFLLVATVFIAALLTANIIAVKLVSFGDYPLVGELILPAAIIVFPISYIIGDILTEVYGFAAARRVIWLGFVANLILVGFIYLGQLLPAAGFWGGQEAYESILGFTGRLLVASFAAYLVGEFINSLVLAKLKVRMEGRLLFVRTIGSTIVGQGVDSAIFITIAFGGNEGPGIWFFVWRQWLFKSLFEIVLTPVTYAAVTTLKRLEGLDVYDEVSDLNPIAIWKT